MSHIQNIIESFKGLSVDELLTIIAAANTEAKEAKATAKQAKQGATKAAGIALDGRHTAGATAKEREKEMVRIMNHNVDDILSNIFPCSLDILHAFRATIMEKCPGFRKAVHIGGQNKHHDIEIHTDIKIIRVELKVKGKTNGNGSPPIILKWRPWKDTVQFLQGQITSGIGSRFLQECGEPMIHAWFHGVVLAFSSKVPEAAGMTFAGYQKAMMGMNLSGKQEDAAKAFITALRAQESLQKELHDLWLHFEEQWLPSHELNHAELENVIREILESKDAWICASRNKIEWVEGLKVIGLAYTGIYSKPNGGTTFTYNLTLQSGDEIKVEKIECKFYWKNGGQGVQNINFLLL